MTDDAARLSEIEDWLQTPYWTKSGAKRVILREGYHKFIELLAIARRFEAELEAWKARAEKAEAEIAEFNEDRLRIIARANNAEKERDAAITARDEFNQAYRNEHARAEALRAAILAIWTAQWAGTVRDLNEAIAQAKALSGAAKAEGQKADDGLKTSTGTAAVPPVCRRHIYGDASVYCSDHEHACGVGCGCPETHPSPAQEREA